MAATAKIVALVDRNGRVVAAELTGAAKAASAGDEPTSSLVSLDGHRAFSVDIPREILSLSGPDLQRYFGEAQIDRDGKLRLPKVRIARGHGDKK